MSAAAASSAVVTIPAREQLMLLINISGYGGGDIASLRFNGDSGTNYWDRHITSIQGGVALVNTQTISTTLLRLAGNSVSTGRIVSCSIMNIANVSKTVGISHLQTGTAAAGTAGTLDFGGGEWVNTSAQITTIQLITAGGQNLSIGTGFTVFGCNP
jgi:hypothetical protein